MERLTCKYDVDNVLRDMCTFDRESNVDADDWLTCFEYCNNIDMNCEKCAIQKAFDKLAEYEDLEEQGLFLKLPCKIGDAVYVVGTRCLAGEEPEEGCTFLDCEECIYDKTYIVFETKVDSMMMCNFMVCDNTNFIFNKTVFLTREEAEKALERLEKDNE